MVHSVSGWTRGVQVKLWDPLRTRAIPERFRGVFTTRRYTNTRLPLPLPAVKEPEPNNSNNSGGHSRHIFTSIYLVTHICRAEWQCFPCAGHKLTYLLTYLVWCETTTNTRLWLPRRYIVPRESVNELSRHCCRFRMRRPVIKSE